MFESLSSFAPPVSVAKVNLAVIGAASFNYQTRIAPTLHGTGCPAAAILYDLKPAPDLTMPYPWVQVHDNQDLLQHLRRQKPTHVLIETTDSHHPPHIMIALQAQAQHVWCEKCLAGNTQQLPPLLAGLDAKRPEQQVGILDHYLNLHLVRLLRELTPAWLGEVQSLSVTLHEQQGILPHQINSHANGMANFFHHVLALASLFFDLDDLEPQDAYWGKEEDSPAPDTFRAARFRSKRTGQVVVDGSVGKYVKKPCKRIMVVGSEGRAFLDRDTNELRLTNPNRCQDLVIRAEGGADTGYFPLAQAIAVGKTAPTLLDTDKAVKTLRLLEQAHQMAQYIAPNGQKTGHAFACEWQLPPIIQR